MITLDEARDHVLANVERLEGRSIPLDDARGLVLAAPVQSPESIPAFANTAMDGFAVRAADTVGAPNDLAIVGTIAAGNPGLIEVGPGQAARIMTGAPMPGGADAVVMVERTNVAENGTSVSIEIEVKAGNHVRGVGEDITAGEEVFPAGVVISPGHLGVLASIGAYDVKAHPRPRVGVLSTGDELVDGPEPLQRGQIRDSNRRTLLALVDEAGFEPIDLGLARDTEDEIERIFRDGVDRCDAVLSSGGVSMGDFDYVKVVLDRIGQMRWMQIAIKPAKPFAFGLVDGVPIFGLPGNPVSSMVSFELLAKPALRLMAGHQELGPSTVTAESDDDLGRGADGKTHFMRVNARLDDRGRWHVARSGGQGSHQLAAMARAEALAIVPDQSQVAVGDDIEIILLR